MTSSVGNLANRTAAAAKWRLAGSAVGAVSQFLIGVLLARLLPPEDFGLMALTFVILGLARPLGDLGLGNAIIQRADLTDRHVRTGFTVSVLFGFTLAAVLALSATLAALGLRDARVAPVLQALSVTFVLYGTSVAADALLRRRLEFHRLFFIDVASYVLGYGAVTCALALLGFGVWSMVWGTFIQTLTASIAKLVCVRHSVKPCLGRREVKELLNFGVGSCMSGCVNYVALTADNFVVGRLLGAGGLGLYNRAYMLMNVPHTYASSVMSSVLFPAFSELQEESARLRRAFLLVTELTAMVAAPAMVTMAIVAPHLVRGLYGPRWMGVVAPLQIFCVAGYFRTLYHLGGVTAQSRGRVYSELRIQAVYALLVLAGALAGARYGLNGIAAGVDIAILGMFILMGRLALSVTALDWSGYFGVQVGAVVTAGVTGAAALLARHYLEASQAPSIVIATAVLAAAACPWCASVLWALGRPEFAQVLPQPIRPLVDLTRRLRHFTSAAASAVDSEALSARSGR
jgi:O-antigen/teichoic acid export membrane protein